MTAAPRSQKARLIDAAWEARADEHEAQLRQLRLALQWALLHPAPVDADGVVDHAGWGELRLVGDPAPITPLAGEGAPLVAPEAPVELAAALGVPALHAQQLIADALELAFRLPRLWTLLGKATLLTGPRVWQARLISRETHDLSLDAALHADRLICAVPDRIGLVDARRLAHEARLHADPDRAVAEEDDALAKRGVWLHRDGAAPATTEVVMTLDTPDAQLLDQSVTRIVADLEQLGDTDPLDVRRARAVGVLADPQHALDLMSGRPDAALSPGGTGSLDLVVHLTPADLTDQPGVASVEGLGAVSTGLLADWLARHRLAGGRVSVRAVVDLADTRTVDAHDPPPLLREQVLLRDAHCVFPGCRTDSRRCDLDHIQPYLDPAHGGPPAQTTAPNLAPLCRRHHHAKTHGGWTYERRGDGSRATYEWTSPTGHHSTVVPVTRAPLTANARRA
ncbi:HNH endonuclease signature motif containing protein [Nocardioides aurantiacus]|nr:HNH endonuclease signature motif containing protein [Nocardioides aurantiacus]